MRFLLSTLLLGLLSLSTLADTFIVDDIRLEGLQRVSVGTVYEALPIAIGDRVNDRRLADVSRILFKSGFFNDIRVLRDGNTLVIRLTELPTITKIEIEGNKAIKSEALLEGLKQSGLAEGRVLKRATLERIALELERQYVAQGRYDAGIETLVTPLPRNRVAVEIQVDEGTVAAIAAVNIIGNKVFDDETLFKSFQLQTSNFWSWYKKDDKYSREKLAADLESLRSFYFDRGYIRFNIESTQVSVSPDKSGVYVNISVSEGDRYDIDSVQIAGDLVIDESELSPLLTMANGDIFSRREISVTSNLMSKRLGNDGYTFAQVNGVPEINDDDKTVDLTFFVNPGKRTYVRAIRFKGNDGTLDEVLRREMVQIEGGWASSQDIETGKRKLNRLGFFKSVDVQTPAVPGTDDMIDVIYQVEEQLSGSLNFNLGYAGASGLILGASVSQSNFMGSGNSLSLGLQKNDTSRSMNFSYTDPFYTIDGVSRGFSVSYRETDFSSRSAFSDFQTNSLGGRVTFGYPISPLQRLSFSTGYTQTEFFEGRTVPLEIRTFVDNQGDLFDEYTVGANWRYSSLNRGLFPTDGVEHRLFADVSLPGSDLTYYKVGYKGNLYLPLSDNWSVRVRTELGYGDGFGDLQRMPFFKNFRAGGLGSIRGYQTNSLGPKGFPEFEAVDLTQADAEGNPQFEEDEFGRPKQDDNAPAVIYLVDNNGAAQSVSNTERFVPQYITDENGSIEQAPLFLERERALGGNIQIETSVELIFPFPFVEDRSSLRSVLFADAGNVFNSDCVAINEPDIPNFRRHPFCDDGISFNDIRTSVGAGVTWVTAIGPLTFTYSIPLNDQIGDRTESFEFSLGQVF